MSTNDYPTARPYYIIEVLSGGLHTRYFVYEAYGSVYLESPYQGSTLSIGIYLKR